MVLGRVVLFLIWALVPALATATGSKLDELSRHRWIHGADDCTSDRNPPIEVFEYDAYTYVLRQNKCMHFEAPFMYLLLGKHTALLIDTGATAEAVRFPLRETVDKLMVGRFGQATVPLLVVHSHGHRDHKAADGQFHGLDHVRVIAPEARGVTGFLAELADERGALELGERAITMFAVPGHHAQSLAFYDSQTRWLITGDTIYPGVISIMDWEAYQASVSRMLEFSRSHPISALLGAHIEMSSTAGRAYRRGTIYQPDEASLVLPVDVLDELNEALLQTRGRRDTLVMSHLIIDPVSWPMRVLTGVLKRLQNDQ